MKSIITGSVLALATVLSVSVTAPAAAADGLKSYQSGNKEFWTHPPDDWFLGDETEAQKGLAPPSGPPTGMSDSEIADALKKIKLPKGVAKRSPPISPPLNFATTPEFSSRAAVRAI